MRKRQEFCSHSCHVKLTTIHPASRNPVISSVICGFVQQITDDSHTMHYKSLVKLGCSGCSGSTAFVVMRKHRHRTPVTCYSCLCWSRSRKYKHTTPSLNPFNVLPLFPWQPGLWLYPSQGKSAPHVSCICGWVFKSEIWMTHLWIAE